MHRFSPTLPGLILGVSLFATGPVLTMAADRPPIDETWRETAEAVAPSPPPPEDSRSSIALLVENDLFAGTDRHYTNGLRLAYLSPEDDLPPYGQWLARNLPVLDPDGRKRIGWAIGQSMFTPRDIDRRELLVNQRPYAGWLYAEVGLVSYGERRMDSATLSFGVIGPLSLAGATQRWWHDSFGFTEPKGWGNQLRNEPAINLTVERKWRNAGRSALPFGLQTDFTPHLGGSLGNVFTHAAAGATARIGHALEDDFGPQRIRPSLPGSDHFTPHNRFGWYLFGGFETRAVLRNIFLDGNTFRSSHSVRKKPIVADFQAGVALIFPRFRLTYTHVLRTTEFEGQTRPDRFGAISLTSRF